MNELGSVMSDPVVIALKKLGDVSNQFGGAYIFVKYGLQALDPISNQALTIDILNPEVKEKYKSFCEQLLLELPALIDLVKEEYNKSIHAK